MFDFKERPAPFRRRVLGALIGIQAGVFGGLAIVGFMIVVAVSEGDPWWAYSNILATAFYGGRALRAGAGWVTISGVALQVLLTGLAGAIFGALFAMVESRSRRLLLGVIWGLSWFYITQSLYRAIARLIPVYAPELALLGAHAVFGLILGRFTVAPADARPDSRQETIQA
jgi:hypothetical protein